MPQMSPLNWLSLYMIFTAALILFCMINYFSYAPMTPETKTDTQKSMKSLNWKW
uniref:ATP synthase complex subunit 8 n=1 Tax=Medetera sp. Qilemoge-2020 TaxID=2766003 RepID=A0A7G8JTP6_9MUSC|nr:ATP synthase F0 subunit 8 [Medetera sp. Qilemoge-2020]